jgi:hypothetical protein
MVAPVTRAHRNGHVPCGRCRRREGFEGRTQRGGEARFVTSGNIANPRIGSRAKQTCTVAEEQTVEVVRNHEGGTREGLAVLPRRDARRRAARASDSTARNDGGAIFGQPQERQSGRQAGPHGSGRDGRVGVKVRRVARTCFRVSRTPVGGTSRAPVGRRKAGRRRSRRGAAKPVAAEPAGDLPPWKAPDGWSGRRETVRGARAQPCRSGCGMPHSRPLGEGR